MCFEININQSCSSSINVLSASVCGRVCARARTCVVVVVVVGVVVLLLLLLLLLLLVVVVVVVCR